MDDSNEALSNNISNDASQYGKDKLPEIFKASESSTSFLWKKNLSLSKEHSLSHAASIRRQSEVMTATSHSSSEFMVKSEKLDGTLNILGERERFLEVSSPNGAGTLPQTLESSSASVATSQDSQQNMAIDVESVDSPRLENAEEEIRISPSSSPMNLSTTYLFNNSHSTSDNETSIDNNEESKSHEGSSSPDVDVRGSPIPQSMQDNIISSPDECPEKFPLDISYRNGKEPLSIDGNTSILSSGSKRHSSSLAFSIDRIMEPTPKKPKITQVCVDIIMNHVKI